MKSSPYLKEGRLAHVIAAIQVMGVYKFYKLPYYKWAERIAGNNPNEYVWEDVFKDHPEFFRIDQDEKRASLVWRRNLPKLYNVDVDDKITSDDYKNLDEEQKKRISRNPLRDEDINMLINSAIQLHSSAIKHKAERRWWISPSLVIIGLFIGSIPTIVRSCKSTAINNDRSTFKQEVHMNSCLSLEERR